MTPIDVLADVLRSVRVRSVSHRRIEAGQPWTLSAASSADPAFHLVLAGRAELGIEDVDPWELGAPSVLVLPHGHAHIIHEGSGPTTSLDELLSGGTEDVARIGRGVQSTLLVSGRLKFDEGRGNPLLKALPKALRLGGADVSRVLWLTAILEGMEEESRLQGPGSQTVMSRLADVLFVHLVRAYIRSQPAEVGGWLSALSEPSIGDALGLVHQRPADPWTVGGLAARVGMSRSSFAARFTQLVGEAPLHYVTRWRMHKAAELLRTSQLSLAEVGIRVGYDSEAAFSKAFKRWSQVSPGAYRRGAQMDVSADRGG